jgi:2-keto-3-deoxy-L-rhamnonate aldolase RhmA
MKNKTTGSGGWISPSFLDTEGSRKVAESLSRGNRLRQLVRKGLAVGTFVIELPCSATLDVLSIAGFDFVVLDLEHSGIGMDRLETLICAGRAAGLVVLVRTPGEDLTVIGKVLDMGAHGIMAPHVDSPEHALEVVQAARFSPAGCRGFSPLSKFDAIQSPLETLGSATYVIVQIEGTKALGNVDQIAQTPGIDAVFVGPYDLSLSLGVDPGSPEIQESARQVADLVPDHVGLGIYVDDPAESKAWAASGFVLQCVSFDGRMLANYAKQVVRKSRGDS